MILFMEFKVSKVGDLMVMFAYVWDGHWNVGICMLELEIVVNLKALNC